MVRYAAVATLLFVQYWNDPRMRLGTVTGLSLLLAVVGGPLRPARRTGKSRPGTQPSLLSEFRFGFSAQDPWGTEGAAILANLTGEILFAKPFTASDLFTSYFIPRPHVGGSLNFDGQTSFAYAGLSWTVDITPRSSSRAASAARSMTASTSTRRPAQRRIAGLLAALPRIRLGRRAAFGELERDGDPRAPDQCRRMLGQSRPDQCGRAGRLYILTASLWRAPWSF